MNELVSIEWKNLNVGQMLYVHAVVVPRIEEVLCDYVLDLKELADEPKLKPLCNKDCEHCIFEEVCIEREEKK